MKGGRKITRSRGACQNCRDRKVKCDESLPICQVCRRSGVECRGYTKPVRWSRKHEMIGTAPSAFTIFNPERGNCADQPQEASYPREHSDVFTGLSENSSNFSFWMNMAFNGSESRSAYEDAALLICQDPPDDPLSFSSALECFNQDTPLEVYDDTRSAQSLDLEASTGNDTIPRGIGPSTNLSHNSHHDPSAGATQSSVMQHRTVSQLLLHTFYRLSSPTRHFTRTSDHDFVGYYFKHVSRLISCFDSDSNTLQRLVVSHWSTSSTVYFTVQSMAIAHISNWYPYMALSGIAKRNQAWRSLQKDLQLLRVGHIELETTLLSLTLLGISASWQSGTNLGLQYLYIARNLIVRGQLQWTVYKANAVVEEIDDFWADTLVYWEMLASFIDPIPITTFDGHGMPNLNNVPKSRHPIMPHPLTGIMTELYFVLAEVGRVWRRQQRQSTSDSSAKELASDELDQSWLKSLVEYLLRIEIPSEDSIEAFHDLNTSKKHLILTAEACRGVCLLEIYELRPQLFYESVNNDSTREELPFNIPRDSSGQAMGHTTCLTAIAVYCLKLLLEVPFSSGTSRLQPLLLVACASRLQLTDSTDDLNAESNKQDHENGTNYRYVAEERMLALSRKFPQSPILRAMDIIKETWEQLNCGSEGAHWIAVMHEKGLQTVLG